MTVIPEDFQVPGDWEPAIEHALGRVQAANDSGIQILVIPTRDLGMRPGTADGIYGSSLFAEVLTVRIGLMAAGADVLDWVVSYRHDERCFILVNRKWIRFTTRPTG